MRTLGCVLLFLAPPALDAAEKRLEFNRDIRPILSDRCYACHGPDARAKRIPLRLDVEAAAKASVGGRRAIVEGDAEASWLVRRITAADPALRMPPEWSGTKLTDREIRTLRDWVAQGARWEKHWSFVPPKAPEIPAVREAGRVRNPIDAFVLARLEREGLGPSPAASRETLLRRVTLDVTGLPPTPAEIDAFLADTAPDAYEKVLDRLFASPRYGERMAARWLDAARYADTNGYQYDGERSMWRWRDWVIDAFNRNQPFDRFALEQLAGDMIPGATREQRIATGFNRNHRGNSEDGIIAEEYAVEYVVDRVETTATVFLGLTVGCARCHNHKYDPFSQREFYRLFAYFNNVPERGRAMKYGNSPPMLSAPTREQQEELRSIEERGAALGRTLAGERAAIDEARAAWERALPRGEVIFWAPRRALALAFPLEDAAGLKAVGGAVAFRPGRIGKAAAFDGSVHLDAGDVAAFDIEDPFTLAAWVHPDGTASGSVLSRMVDEPKGKGYSLELDDGRVRANVTSDWTTDALRLVTTETLAPGRWHHVAMTYTGSRLADGVRVYVDGRPAPCRVEIDTLYRPFRNAGRPFKEPVRIGGGAGPERRFRGLIDDARVYSRVLGEEELGGLALGEPLATLAARPPAERSPGERFVLERAFLERAAPDRVREAWREIEALADRKDALERGFPTVMVMAESPTPRSTFLLVRGAYDHPGERVEPGIPASLPPLPAGAPDDRLGFARWLVDPANPLTARVAVNRFWQMLFGTGLVKTTEDFGSQGEWPSHPELLDWLATRFVRSGWDVKALLRTILSSATYRQSSRATPELLQRDPDNRLLARGPRFRLPAEIIRDQALAAAGLLRERLGGPSVKPYQPDGLWAETSMQDMDYNQSKGPDLYRRSLYTFWKRTIAPPMMVHFDAPMRESCAVRETRTNTPLQALNLMNDVTFVEAARALGERMMKEGGAARAARLGHGFRLAAGRRPSPAEEAVLGESLAFHIAYFGKDEGRANQYLRHGEKPPDRTLDPRELAAYAAVGSLILNLDEVVTKQ